LISLNTFRHTLATAKAETIDPDARRMDGERSTTKESAQSGGSSSAPFAGSADQASPALKKIK
jgi:hypothetical protein